MRMGIAKPSTLTVDFFPRFQRVRNGELPQKIHEAMIKKHYGQKLAGHISRDSTAIESREKPAKTPKDHRNPKENAAATKKGEVVASKPRKRVELQAERIWKRT
jgi:hypothetical protein